MPRKRLLSPEAEAEALRYLRDPKNKRTHSARKWGEQPSLRDVARYLFGKRLVGKVPHAGAIARARGYRNPHERRRVA